MAIPTKTGQKFTHHGKTYTVDYFLAHFSDAEKNADTRFNTLKQCVDKNPGAVFYAIINKEFGGICDVKECSLIKR